MLGYPGPKLPYVLDTDASNEGVGAVLSQLQDGEERVIGYYSKTLTPPERNYCVTRRELLALVKGVKQFRPYLYGQKFTLRTDHASLCGSVREENHWTRWHAGWRLWPSSGIPCTTGPDPNTEMQMD